MEAFSHKETTLRWHGHSSVSLSMPGTRIYVDPYQLRGRWPDATHVLITHPHYDHLEPDSIRKIDDGDTEIICPRKTPGEKLPVPERRITRLKPGQSTSLPDRPITINAKPAYNPDRRFHPKSKEWLGYVIETKGSRIYHAGDTGPVPIEFEERIDLGLVPVDGIYTMSANEASTWVDEVDIDRAVPIHYGTERGSMTDAVQFRRGLDDTEPVNLEKTRLIV